jgi:16S rRNA (cytosine1402-N4)-methyltransferase
VNMGSLGTGTGTPTRHIPVLLEEAVGALNIKSDGIYVDGTFGRGGHSRRILERLGESGRLIALDKDPAAIEAAREIRDARFQAVHESFARLRVVLGDLSIPWIDGILLDLGLSSAQLEDAARGFSFRSDGPLDMRMDRSRGVSAADWLATASEADIRRIVKDYGEERFAAQVARAIIAARAIEPIVATGQLARIVASAVATREPDQHPATRTFQAIRIFVNRELDDLSAALPQAVDALAPAGRLAVISFHSLEDRIVKRFVRAASRPDALPRALPLRHHELPQPRLRLIGRPVRSSPAETLANPRARSALLRVAERVAGA